MALLAGLICQIFFTSARAEDATQDLWEGYRDTDKLAVPFKSYLRNAIFTVRSFSIFDPKAQAIPPKIIELNLNQKRKKLPKDWLTAEQVQVETCRMQGLSKCPIMEEESYGTAFVQGGKEVWTCRHLFEQWLFWAAKLNDRNFSELIPPFELLNNHGVRTVFSTAQLKNGGAQKISLGFFNREPKSNYIPPMKKWGEPEFATFDAASKKEVAKKFDVAQFLLSLPITKEPGLPMALTINEAMEAISNSAGKNIYFTGFPGQVEGLKIAKTDGWTKVSTVGRLKLTPVGDARFLTTAFSYRGMSGAPAISEDGRILGITCTVNNMNEAAQYPKNVGAVFQVLDQKFLQDIWKRLPYP